MQGAEASSVGKQCYSCHEYGHMMRECPKTMYKSNEPSREYLAKDENMECYNCHQIGHRSRDCTAPKNFDKNDGNRSYFGRDRNRGRQSWGNEYEVTSRGGGRRNQRHNDNDQRYEYDYSRRGNDNTGHHGERRSHVNNPNANYKNDNSNKPNWRHDRPERFVKSADGDEGGLTGGFSSSVETAEAVNLVSRSRNASNESAHSKDNTCDSEDVKENAECARSVTKKTDDRYLEPQSMITALIHNNKAVFSASMIDVKNEPESYHLPEIFCQNCQTPGHMKNDCPVESPSSLRMPADDNDVMKLLRSVQTTNIVPPPARYSVNTTPVAIPSNIDQAPSTLYNSGQVRSSPPNSAPYYEHDENSGYVENQYHGNLPPSLENSRSASHRRSGGRVGIQHQHAQISSQHYAQPYSQNVRTPRYNLAPPLSSTASCYANPTYQEDTSVRNSKQSSAESQVNKQQSGVYLKRIVTTVETQTDPVEIISKESETKVEIDIVAKDDSPKVEIKRTKDVGEKQNTLVELLEQDVNNCFPLGNFVFLDKTVVFVERKRIADYLVNLLAQNGIGAVTVHDELSQIENEKNLIEFFAGVHAVLICPLIFMDDPCFEKHFNEQFSSINVLIFDLPENLIEIQGNFGFGREDLKKMVIFYGDKMDGNSSADLVRILSDNKEMIPDWLLRLSRQYAKNVNNNAQTALIDNSYSSNIWD